MGFVIKVLCVEDDPDDELQLREGLHEIDYARVEVDCASTLTVAQRLLVLEQFDLLIIDYHLRGDTATGLDLAHFLAMQGSRVPMLLVSGREDLPLKEQDNALLDSGLLHFLRKEEIVSSTLSGFLRRILSTSIRLLHVDDDADDRQIVAECLAESPVYQFDLVQVASIEDAAIKMARQKFDVYLLDYHLAQGNGAELARQILQGDPSAAIVLCTGMNLIHHDARALAVIGSRRAGFLSKKHMNTSSLVRAIVNSRNTPVYFSGRFSS